MSVWISTNEQLPEVGKYVLARHNRGTWIDSTDQDNVNCVVVKRVKDKIEGNNRVPYSWSEFGPDHFFGQSITEWTHIPKGESNGSNEAD